MIATDSTSIRAALEGLKDLPVVVSAWEVEIGPDASDQDAVWVWGFLAEENPPANALSELRDRVREAVKGVSDTPIWVYVRFRGSWER